MSTQNIPVIAVTGDQIGPLGLALGSLPDQGGSTDAALPVPVVDPVRYDERQTCRLAHEYLAAHGYALEPDVADYCAGYISLDRAHLPAYTACQSYREGRCGGTGYRAPCLFREPPASPGWRRACRWRRLPSGDLCRAGDYDALLADARAWPSVRDAVDLVARSYGILADAAGAVRDDRLIVTTGADLSLALAWCLALLGCDESAIPTVLGAWAPAALADPEADITLPASAIYGAISMAALHAARQLVALEVAG